MQSGFESVLNHPAVRMFRRGDDDSLNAFDREEILRVLIIPATRREVLGSFGPNVGATHQVGQR